MEKSGNRNLPADRPRGWTRRIAGKLSSLRFQVMGIVVTSVLIPFLLGGWFAGNRISDLLRRQVFLEIEGKTQKLSDQLGGWFNERFGEVQAFTVSYLLNEDLRKLQTGSSAREREISRKNIHSYLTYLLEDNAYFSGITLYGPDGSPIIAQPSGSTPVMEVVREIPDSGQTIREMSTEDGPRLILLQKMELGRGLAPNIFSAVMKLDHLRNKMVELAPPGSVVYLVDPAGDIKAANVVLGDTQKAPDGAVALFFGGEGLSIHEGLTGREVIATSGLLEVPRWGVVMETSKKEALKPLDDFRWQVIYMAMALAGLFLVPALLLARTLVLPLEELSRVSRRIRAGKPGLQVRSRIGGELGEFITTFNSMSLSLAESLEQITAKNEELRVMSITDPLTGRYNRRYIKDYLDRALELAVRTEDPMGILMIDIDHFKEYNDTYGHIAGDMVLKGLGEILVRTVRRTDVVARYGGEEWIVCLNHAGRQSARRIADKLRRTVEEATFELKGHETRITVSIGMAIAPEDGSVYTTIVEAADTAMYTAKAKGRNRVEIFTGPDPP